MSLKDRLRERQLPQATVGLRMDWSSESYQLHEDLARAERDLVMAEAAGDDDLDQRRSDVDELRAKVDALYEYLTIKALPAQDMEELVNNHPPTAEQVAEDPNAGFNRTTFFPALLAACVEGTETAEDWQELLTSGELVIGEVNALIGTAMSLNDRSPSVSLGKGLTTTSS